MKFLEFLEIIIMEVLFSNKSNNNMLFRKISVIKSFDKK